MPFPDAATESSLCDEEGELVFMKEAIAGFPQAPLGLS